MSRYTKKPNYTLKELKEAIGKENIYILEDKGIDINEDINLVGRKDRIFKNKKDSEELIKEVDKNKYIIGDCQTVVCGRATIVWQLFLWKQTLFFMRTEIFFHKLRCMYNLFKIKTFNRQN